MSLNSDGADETEQKEKTKKVKMLCRGLRRDLKKCLLETDCVKIDQRLPRDCLNNDPRTPHECHVLAQEFFECKRQWAYKLRICFMLPNGTCHDCWDLGPPPDMILTIPPPPMPTFFASSVLPLGKNRSSVPCPLLCDWTTGQGIEIKEELTHRGAPAEPSWFLLSTLSFIIVLLFGMLTVLYLLKCRQNHKIQKSSHKTTYNDRTYESILYPSLKENHVLWATLNPKGRPRTIAITSLPPPLPPREMHIRSFENGAFADLDDCSTRSTYRRPEVSPQYRRFENLKAPPINCYPSLSRYDVPSLL